MRRFHAFLLTAGLMAAPAGAFAGPPSPMSGAAPASDPPAAEWLPGTPRLGVMVMTLSPELRAHFGSTDQSGVLVARVEPGSPAALAGIVVGDVIVDVKGTKVDDAGDVRAALANLGSEPRASVKVLRDKQPRTFDVRFDRPTTGMLDALPGLRWLREMFVTPDRPSST
jgi:membrane-associated protease RseP (regulator of RpoE activity)